VLQIADLMFFILLCIVFLLAYGVAAQSLLYPNAEARWDILYRVVYHPYFSMYQEFPLDELEGIQHSCHDRCSRFYVLGVYSIHFLLYFYDSIIHFFVFSNS